MPAAAPQAWLSVGSSHSSLSSRARRSPSRRRRRRSPSARRAVASLPAEGVASSDPQAARLAVRRSGSSSRRMRLRVVRDGSPQPSAPIGVPSASRESDQRHCVSGVAGSSVPSPASRRVKASRAAARSGSGTATANQSRPSRSRSSIPNARHAVPLAISTRPCSSSATISASAPSKLRRARARDAAAGEIGGELAADGGEQRRDLAVGLAHLARVELDHAHALVAERDRERGRGDQAGAHDLAGSSRDQTGRRKAQTRPARPWPAA